MVLVVLTRRETDRLKKPIKQQPRTTLVHWRDHVSKPENTHEV